LRRAALGIVKIIWKEVARLLSLASARGKDTFEHKPSVLKPDQKLNLSTSY